MRGAGPEAGAPRTLWRDEARRRFYLVPDAVEPAPGALVLRAGASRRVSVDEASVAAYEVPKDEARAFLDAKLDGFVGGVKRTVEGALSALGIPHGPAGSSASPNESTESGASPDSAPDRSAMPAEPGPGVRLFAALTGEAAEQVTEPEVFLRALRKIGDQAVDLTHQALQGEEGKAAARARLRALADTLREHGIAVPGSVDDDEHQSPEPQPPA